MTGKKLNNAKPWDRRMLELMDYCIREKKVGHQKDFCQKIGIFHTAITQVRAGRASFRHEHILKASTLWQININWIYGIEGDMLRILDQTSGLDLIKEGLRMLQADAKSPVEKAPRMRKASSN